MIVATTCGVILIKTMKSNDIDTIEQPVVQNIDEKQIPEFVALPNDESSNSNDLKKQMHVDSPKPLTDDDIRSLPDALRYDAITGEPLYPDIDGPEARLSQAEIDEMNELNEGGFDGPEIRLSQAEIDEMNETAAY